MTACVLIDFTVYFLLKAKFSPGSRKGALHQIQQQGWILGVEKTCNLTVALGEAEVQSRIHIWNCYLPTSKHAEGGLNICSGCGQTTSPCSESFLILMARNVKSGRQRNSVCFLGRSCCLWAPSNTSVAVLCSWANPCFSGGSINPQAVLSQALSSSQNWTGTKSKLFSLIKKSPGSKHLFFPRSMINLVFSWKEKGFKIHFSFQLFLHRNARGPSVLSVSLRPAVKSGYETLPCLSWLGLFITPLVPHLQITPFQVSFWSPSRHRIPFTYFYFPVSQTLKSKREHNVDLSMLNYWPKEQPH